MTNDSHNNPYGGPQSPASTKSRDGKFAFWALAVCTIVGAILGAILGALLCVAHELVGRPDPAMEIAYMASCIAVGMAFGAGTVLVVRRSAA